LDRLSLARGPKGHQGSRDQQVGLRIIGRDLSQEAGVVQGEAWGLGIDGEQHPHPPGLRIGWRRLCTRAGNRIGVCR
jgi:hypothetical protein